MLADAPVEQRVRALDALLERHKVAVVPLRELQKVRELLFDGRALHLEREAQVGLELAVVRGETMEDIRVPPAALRVLPRREISAQISREISREISRRISREMATPPKE